MFENIIEELKESDHQKISMNILIFMHGVVIKILR